MDRLRALETIGTVPKHLAYSAGEYCSPTSGLTAHWGLGTDVYCHASSPIRRWADCLNQADLIDILFGQYLDLPLPDIENLNTMGKAIKRYERDLTFVRVLMGSAREVSGIVVECSPNCEAPSVPQSMSSSTEGTLRKLRVWVEAWNQIVTVKGEHDFLPGATLDLKIFFDAGQRNWKRRMVLNLS